MDRKRFELPDDDGIEDEMADYEEVDSKYGMSSDNEVMTVNLSAAHLAGQNPSEQDQYSQENNQKYANSMP
jgi:hypothetical protein